MGALVEGKNDLYTFCINNDDLGKAIMQEWTGECITDNKIYSIQEVHRASRKKFNWVCIYGHKWASMVVSRTSEHTQCPYCSGKLVIKGENDLKTWCLANGDYGEQVAKEWTGHCINDNLQYKLDEVTALSAKKFEWKCDKGHTWEAKVQTRTFQKSCCTECYKKTVKGRKIKLRVGENDLKTWCLNNGDYGKQVASEWTGQCVTDNLHYNLDEVTKASNRRFKWICSKGHEWDANVFTRTSSPKGCPYCSGRAVLKGENDLETWCKNVGDYGKLLMSQWTGYCFTDDHYYNPDEVVKGSSKVFRWKCSYGHEWKAQLYSRTREKTGCPVCFRQQRKSKKVS